MNEDTENQIKGLLAEQDAVSRVRNKAAEEMHAANARLRDIQLSLATLRFGVRVGSIVRSGRFGGREHRVTVIGPVRDKPWLSGSPRRKDGTFGAAVCQLFDDWELVTP